MKVATPASLALVLALACMASLLGRAHGDGSRCGKDFSDALCPDHLCCSEYGYCGDTYPYCGPGCQSRCVQSPPPPFTPLPPIPPDSPVGEIVSKDMFERLLFPHAGVAPCEEGKFVTYEALLAAATLFPKFAAEGDLTTRKRELAAFFAQTGHETTGGWPPVPVYSYSWGYCFMEEHTDAPYCDPSNAQYPCVAGKSYHGRGPIQLSWNYNYGAAGEALGLDLLHYPEKVLNDPLTAFQTAIWFWMTPQAPKPSCHDVIIGKWKPSQSDINQGRLPGFGVTTNIINGGIECNTGDFINEQAADRVIYYKHFCDVFGVSYGDNLDCNHQQPFGYGYAAAMTAVKEKYSYSAE